MSIWGVHERRALEAKSSPSQGFLHGRARPRFRLFPHRAAAERGRPHREPVGSRGGASPLRCRRLVRRWLIGLTLVLSSACGGGKRPAEAVPPVSEPKAAAPSTPASYCE